MALDDLSGRHIHRSAKADADRRNPVALDERPGDLHELPADAFRAVRRANGRPLDRFEPGVYGRADAKLQFRAADFNAEKSHFADAVVSGPLLVVSCQLLPRRSKTEI